MLIYKKTFDNVRTVNCNFPVEDQFYADDMEAIVADGITRDPIGVLDLSACTLKEMVEKYPRPSGAELASREICDTFSRMQGTLKEKLIEANKSVKRLNDKYIKECDYLQNDYYGAVASCIHLENNILDYAYICECGVIVYDNLGNIKFQTVDDKEVFSDQYIDKNMSEIGIPWNLPEARVIVRRDYRNNLDNIQDGKCVSYGAITGEESAIEFIRYGQLELSNGDIILVYSDGFSNLLHDKEFISQLIDFNKEKFEEYINMKSLSDFSKYGSEKTMVLFKN